MPTLQQVEDILSEVISSRSFDENKALEKKTGEVLHLFKEAIRFKRKTSLPFELANDELATAAEELRNFYLKFTS